MNMKHGMDKWNSRLVCVALILAVLCGMALPGRAWATASGAATESSETASGENGRGEASGGNVSDNEIDGNADNANADGSAVYESADNNSGQTTAELYLAEIDKFKTEAQAIDSTASDAKDQCADIYNHLMEVYTAAFNAYDADEITEEEHDEIYNAVGEVITLLYGYGYDPYATATLERHDEDDDDNNNSYSLSMSHYQPSSTVYWQVMTAKTSGGYEIGTQSLVASVTLNGSDVQHTGDSTIPSTWSDGKKLSTYYSGLKTGDTSQSKKLIVTPKEGYSVKRVIVACCGQSRNRESPYKCDTWQADNAYEKEYTVSKSGAVELDLPSEAFGHSSDSPTYVILIEVLPIPTPLYVEYDYGEIVNYLNKANVNTSVFITADAWTDDTEATAEANETSKNYYGMGGVLTDDTQFKYAYETTDSDSSNAAEAAKWKHYANTVTIEAKKAAAAAGYYFTGWKALYYTTVAVSDNAEGAYNNYKFTFSDQYGDGNTIYNENENVVLTTNVQLVAQWAPVELKVTKTVTGLTGDHINTYHSYAINVEKWNEAETAWVTYKTVTITVNGNNSNSTTVSPVTPGKYRVVEAETSKNNLQDDADTLYISVSDGGEITYTEENIANKTQTAATLNVTNSYSTAIPKIKLVKKWQDANGNPVDGGDKTATLTVGGTDYVLNDDNQWIEVIDVPTGEINVTEKEIAQNYELVGIVKSTETATIDGVNYVYTVYTATNKLSTTNITISKTVSGGLGDWNKEFTFEAQVYLDEVVYKLGEGNYSNSDGATYTVDADGKISFSLSHGESVSIVNIPLGATISVVETNAADYDITVNGATLNNTSYEATVVSDTEISFNNYKDAIPDTGILLDSIPYILILVLVIAGVVFFLFRMRKKREDE